MKYLKFNVCLAIMRVFLVSLIIINLTGQGEVSQMFYHHYSYHNYYFLNYVVVSSLTFSFPIYVVYHFITLFIGAFKKRPKNESIVDSSVLDDPIKTKTKNDFKDKEEEIIEEVGLQINIHENDSVIDIEKISPSRAKTGKEDQEKTLLEVIKFSNQKRLFLAALCLNPLQSFASFFWYISLDYIPASVTQTLYQSVNIFLFFLAFLFCLKEELRYIWAKGVLVFISFVGITIISFFSSGSTQTFHDGWIGITTGIVEAAFYALYQALYVRFLGEISIPEIFLFQSFNGIVTLLFFWPPVIIFDQINYEKFQMSVPISLFLLISCLLTIWYEVNINMALKWCQSPLYVSMSCQLTVLLSLLIDLVFRGISIYYVNFFGIFLVVGSNLVLNVIYILPEDECAFYKSLLSRSFWRKVFCRFCR